MMPRLTLTCAGIEHENALFLDDPIEADLNKRPRCLAPKIGTEPRF